MLAPASRAAAAGQAERGKENWWLRAEAPLVFVVTLALLLFLLPRTISTLQPASGDEPYYLLMAHSLWYDHDLDLENNYANRDYQPFYPHDLVPAQAHTARAGSFDKHGVGLPALIAPFYRLGGRVGAALVIVLCAALLAANLYLLARESSGSRLVAVAVWIACSFTIPLLPFSFLIFPEIPAALIVTYAYRHARLERGSRRGSSLLVGGALAILPWLNPRFLPLLAMCCLLLAISWRRHLLHQLAVAVPVVAATGGLVAYYVWFFGRPLPNYGDHARLLFPDGTAVGFFGTFFDQQWGLLLYAPLYLLATVGVAEMARTQRRELGRWSLVVMPYLLFVSSYAVWWAEWNPPGRYAVAILPLLSVPVAAAWRALDRLPGRLCASLFVLTSLVTSGIAVWQPWLLYNHPTGRSRLLVVLSEHLGRVYLPSLFPSLVQLVGGRDIMLTLSWVAVTGIVAALLWSFGRKGSPVRAEFLSARKELP